MQPYARVKHWAIQAAFLLHGRDPRPSHRIVARLILPAIAVLACLATGGVAGASEPPQPKDQYGLRLVQAATAEDSEQPRQLRSERRDEENLKAQQEMARAADEMVSWNKWQAIIAAIKVSVDVRNIGKTPALEVYTTLRLVPATQYGQDQIKAFYAEVRGKKDHHPRGVLLAGEAYKRDWEVSLSKADLESRRGVGRFGLSRTYRLFHLSTVAGEIRPPDRLFL